MQHHGPGVFRRLCIPKSQSHRLVNIKQFPIPEGREDKITQLKTCPRMPIQANFKSVFGITQKVKRAKVMRMTCNAIQKKSRNKKINKSKQKQKANERASVNGIPRVDQPASYFFIQITNLLTDLQSERSVDGAAVGSMVVGREEVGIRALGVAGLAGSGRAAATRLAGLDGEAVLGELGVLAHVDDGQIPVDELAADGVLVLEDVGLVGLGGELDRDTAATGGLLPVLGVGAAVGGQSVHLAVGAASNGPEVDVLVKVVLDLDTAAAGGAAAGGRRGRRGNSRGRGAAAAGLVRGVGEGRSKGCEGGRKAESLGEHHLVWL